MDNKTIIIVIAIAVAALGGVLYLFSSSSGVGGVESATTTLSISTSTQATSSTSAVKSGTTKKIVIPAKIAGIGPISYLFDLKKPLVCSINTTGPIKRSGTMYVSNGKMRSNFYSSSMIDDGMYLYAWKSGATKGLMLIAASSASGSAIASNGGFDPATDISYVCGSWKEDASVFTPPPSVSFSNTL